MTVGEPCGAMAVNTNPAPSLRADGLLWPNATPSASASLVAKVKSMRVEYLSPQDYNVSSDYSAIMNYQY